MLLRRMFAVGLLLISGARADLTIVEKVEGGGNNGETKLRIKGDKARADIAPQISMITDLNSNDVVTLQHSAKVYLRVPAEQAKAIMEKVKEQQNAASAEPPKPVAAGRKEKVGQHECEVFTWSTGNIKATDWIAADYPNAEPVIEALERFQQAGLSGAASALQPSLKEYGGMLVKRELTINGQKTTKTLVSVSEEAIDDAVFELPKEYKEQPAPAFPFGGPAK